MDNHPSDTTTRRVMREEQLLDQIDSLQRQLEPVRKLHRKSPTYNRADDCETCCDERESVQNSHERVETPDGDFLCTSVVVGYCCAHCATLRSHCGEEPGEWPCETAKLVNSADDLL